MLKSAWRLLVNKQVNSNRISRIAAVDSIKKMGVVFFFTFAFVTIAGSQSTDSLRNLSTKKDFAICPLGDKCECKECSGTKCDGCHRHFDLPYSLNATAAGNDAANNLCIKYRPFCADGVLTFETSVCPYCSEGVSGVCNFCAAQNPDKINYGCLISQPRPAWFVMKVKTAGAIQIRVESDDTGSDIDIAIWGPFDSPTEACENYFYGQKPVENPDGSTACSYSNKYYELLNIQEAVAEKYYVMVVTNYSNRLSNVSITQPNKNADGAGELDCDMVYECSLLSLTANTTECTNGKYSVSGVLDFTNPPAEGRLCITNSASSDIVYINPPYQNQSNFSYSFNDLTCDGKDATIKAWFENDTDCAIETTYSAPVDLCATMTVEGSNKAVCEGDSVMVVFKFQNAIGPISYSYTYNGVKQTVNNITKSSDTLWVKETAVIKAVSVSSEDCTSGSASGEVSVTVRALPRVILNDVEICSGVHIFDCGVGGSAYSYLWKKIENDQEIPIGTLSTYRASLSGTYKVTVVNKVTGCRKSDSASLIIHSETKPTLTASPDTICAGGAITLTASSDSKNVLAYKFFKNGQEVQNSESTTYTEENYGEQAYYTVKTVVEFDNQICESAASDSATVALSPAGDITITIPNNISLYVDDNCYANIDTAITGSAKAVNSGCSSSNNITISFVDSESDSPRGKVISRTWTARNLWANQTVHGVQTITLIDTIAPTFTVPSNSVVSKDENCEYNGSISNIGSITDAQDNCTSAADLIISYSDIVRNDTVIRTWSVSDIVGNTTVKDQIIVIEDKIAPSFVAPADISIPSSDDCLYDANPKITGNITDLRDNCTSVDLLLVEYRDSVVDNTIIRTWIVSDQNENTAIEEQIITITDTTAPVISVPDSVIVYSDANCEASANTEITGVATAYDNCTTAENIEITYNDLRNNNIITRTWQAVDAAGNQSTANQIITIIDTIAPYFDIPDDIIVYKNANCEYDASADNASNVYDNCTDAENIIVSYSDLFMDGTIARTWIATDEAGNRASKIQIISIIDTIAPTFDIPEDITVYTNANCEYSADTAITGTISNIADNCTESADLQISYKDELQENQILRTWIVADSDSNIVVKTQIITIADTIAPTFTAPDDTDIYSGNDCSANATTDSTGNVLDAVDNCTASEKLTITYDDELNENILIRTWSVADEAGNVTRKTQTITIIDKISPEFTVPEDVIIYKDANCNYDARPEITGVPTNITDNCTSIDNLFVRYIDTIVDNTITRMWIVKDKSENGTSKLQIISIADTAAPTITVAAQNIVLETDGNGNTEQIAAWLNSNGGAQASCCDGAIVWSNNHKVEAYEESSVCETNRSQNVTFTATNQNGYSATTSATISIVDTKAPQIISQPKALKVYCRNNNVRSEVEQWLAANGGMTAEDIGSVVTYSNNFADFNIDLKDVCRQSESSSLHYNIEFTASDKCGNTTTETVSLEIVTSMENVIVVRNYTRNYGDVEFPVNAIASSKLPVEFKVLEGNSVNIYQDTTGAYKATINSSGVTLVEASQAGNNEYSPAIPLRFTITVNKAKLIVGVRDESIKEGDELPQIYVVYSGFAYGENENDLIKKPITKIGSSTIGVNYGIPAELTPGEYTIKVFGAVAEDYDIEYVNGTLEVLDTKVKFGANAFTPNGDGLNDIFGVGNHIKVYNKIGSEIFAGENGWDGLDRRTGRTVDTGVYYYVMVDRTKNKTYKGSVEVLK